MINIIFIYIYIYIYILYVSIPDYIYIPPLIYIYICITHILSVSISHTEHTCFETTHSIVLQSAIR